MSQQGDRPPHFNPGQARSSRAWDQILEMMGANAQEAPGRSETHRAVLSPTRVPTQMPNNNRPEPPSSPGVWGSNTSPHVFGGITRRSNAQEAPAEPEPRRTIFGRLERLSGQVESLLEGSNNLGDVVAPWPRRTSSNRPQRLPHQAESLLEGSNHREDAAVSEHRRTGTNDPARLPQVLPQDSPNALLFSSVQERLEESHQTLDLLRAEWDAHTEAVDRLLNRYIHQPANVEHFTSIPAEDLAHDEECPICQFPYDKGEHVAIKLQNVSCDHVFGKECLQTWVNSGAHMAHTCPSCRQSIAGALSMPPMTARDGLARPPRVHHQVIEAFPGQGRMNARRAQSSFVTSSSREELNSLLAQLDAQDNATNSFGQSASFSTHMRDRPDTPPSPWAHTASRHAMYRQPPSHWPNTPTRGPRNPQPAFVRQVTISSPASSYTTTTTPAFSSTTAITSERSGADLWTRHRQEESEFNDRAFERIGRARAAGRHQRTIVESAVMMERAAMAARHTREENADAMRRRLL